MEIITAMLAIFSGIGDWLVTTIPDLMTMFYAEGSLTFLGALGVSGLAISVIFLCIGVIQNFLHFRG